MGRRQSGFGSLFTSMANETARAHRQAAANRQRQIREQARAIRQAERAQTAQLKEEKQRHLEERIDEVTEKNLELEEFLAELDDILNHKPIPDYTIIFDSLLLKDEFPPCKIPDNLLLQKQGPDSYNFIRRVEKPNFITALFPGSKEKYEKALKVAEKDYDIAVKKYEEEEAERNVKIKQYNEEYELKKKAYLEEIQQKNLTVEEFKKAYIKGDVDAIKTYNSMLFERSEYPDGFPQKFRIAYVPDSKQLVVEYELPPIEIIPSVQEYKYIKVKDTIEEKPKKQNEIKELYKKYCGRCYTSNYS